MGEFTASVSWVFPMFNERQYIEAAIKKAVEVLEQITDDGEIIVVDDASNDGSGEILARLARADGRIKVIRHSRNRKLGGSLKSGFAAATKDIVIYSDIDLPFDFLEAGRAVAMLDGADMVVGRRKGGRESFLRQVYSFVYNRLIQSAFGAGIHDVNFAFKVFRRNLLNDISLVSEGSFINAELIVKALGLGYRIKEIEVEYAPRQFGVSRLSTPAVIAKILWEMMIMYPGLRNINRDKILNARTRDIYKGRCFLAELHTFLRFRSCPFPALRRLLPHMGKFLDLGCGWGFFTYLLAIDSSGRFITGVDCDSRKINLAQSLRAPGLNVNFIMGDIASPGFALPAKEYDCVMLIDFLCYLPYASQEELLKRCFFSLSQGGMLLLKETGKSPRWKYIVNFIQEAVNVKIAKTTKAKGLYFRDEKEFVELLERTGFSVDYIRLDKGRVHPHVAFVCRKI